MSDTRINSFTSYSLSDDAILQGSVLTETQRKLIQNQLANAAEQRLALDYDVSQPSSFLQQEAYLKGQIEAFRYLLDASEVAIESLTFNPNITPTEGN